MELVDIAVLETVFREEVRVRLPPKAPKRKNVKKICSKCKLNISLEDFTKRGEKYRGVCKVCDNLRKKETRLKRKKQAIMNLGGKCSHCNTVDNLEFHHIDNDKVIEVSSLFGYSMKRIMTEADKCILLCRKCHIKEHN
jgi:hypothetical protein